MYLLEKLKPKITKNNLEQYNTLPNGGKKLVCFKQLSIEHCSLTLLLRRWLHGNPTLTLRTFICFWLLAIA